MLANFVKETVSAAPLTGDMLLNGKSDAAHIAFGTAYADGEQVRYLAADGDDRELGEGTYNATADSITRNTIIETIDSGVFDNTNPTAISLTASTIVHIVSSDETSVPVRKQQWDQRYVCAPIRDLTSSFGGFAASRLYAVGFRLTEAITVDQLSFRLTTLQAGSNALLGIYDSANSGKPTNLLFSTAELDSSTATGIISGSISPIYRLKPGFYFSVIWSDAAIDVGGASTYTDKILGFYDTTGMATTLQATKTYATTLPADISGETWSAHTGTAPGIIARRSA